MCCQSYRWLCLRPFSSARGQWICGLVKNSLLFPYKALIRKMNHFICITQWLHIPHMDIRDMPTGPHTAYVPLHAVHAWVFTEWPSHVCINYSPESIKVIERCFHLYKYMSDKQNPSLNLEVFLQILVVSFEWYFWHWWKMLVYRGPLSVTK